MTITAAHISPIVALVAGVLILIMPRFLNFIVAIYLIVVGLAGLGVFKMFRFERGKAGFRGLRGTPQNGVRRAIFSPFLDSWNPWPKPSRSPKKL